MIEFDGIPRRPTIPMRVQIQRMDLKAFRGRFREPIGGIMKIIQEWNTGGIRGSSLAGYTVKLFARKSSDGRSELPRRDLERALKDQCIDPWLAHDIFSLFSNVALLEMHAEGKKLEEIHISKMLLIEPPDEFMESENEPAKIRQLEDLGVVKILRKTAEQMRADREQQIKDLAEQKVRDRSWPYRNFRRK